MGKYLLSGSQKNYILTHKHFPGMTNLNICCYRNFENADTGRLRSAVESFCEICEAAGTVIDMENPNQPCFVTKENTKTIIEVEHFSRKRQDFFKYLLEFASRDFDLDKSLLRFCIATFDDESAILIAVFSHLVADYYGSQAAMQKITDIYETLISGKGGGLSGKMPSYFEYLDERQAYSKTKAYKRDIAFWQEYYSQEYVLGNLYKKSGKPKKFSDFFAKNTIFPAMTDEDEKKALSNIAHICRFQQSDILAAVFELLCCAYMGKRNISVNFYFHGRFGREKEIVGDMVQNITMPVNIDENQSIKDL